jgi:circadian clock protein KaiB
MSKVRFKLYVTGRTPNSLRAVANLRRICQEALQGQAEMEIVDVLENPHLAEVERILATPTLVTASPLPSRRIVGDLSDADKVLRELELQPQKAPEREGGKP